MNKSCWGLMALFLCLNVHADGVVMLAKPDGTPYGTLNNGLPVSLSSTISGEDQTNNVIKVEQQFSYCANKTADAQCGASGKRFVHTLTCAGNDAAATAGSVALSDATAAGSGNVLVIGFAAAYFAPVTVTIDATFTTGIYLDFTTTADVSCTVSYR